MSKKRSKVRFQNEFDLIKVHYKKQSRGQSLTCLDMFNGRRHLRKRSAAGILWGSLLLTVISATVLGKTITVVYASDFIFSYFPIAFAHLFPARVQERILLCRILRLRRVAISDIYLSAAVRSCPAGLFML